MTIMMWYLFAMNLMTDSKSELNTLFMMKLDKAKTTGSFSLLVNLQMWEAGKKKERTEKERNRRRTIICPPITSPNWEKYRWSSSQVTSWGNPPTKIFVCCLTGLIISCFRKAFLTSTYKKSVFIMIFHCHFLKKSQLTNIPICHLLRSEIVTLLYNCQKR